MNYRENSDDRHQYPAPNYGAGLERAWSGPGASLECEHFDLISTGNGSGKTEFHDTRNGSDDYPSPNDDRRNGRISSRIDRLLCVSCAALLLLAAWQGMRRIEYGGVYRWPDSPALGEAGYPMSMVRTIGELIEREGLRGKRMAVWGGAKAKAHDLPFRWRITADWFLLPEKGVPVLARADEVVDYEYILSPWNMGKRLDGKGRSVELVADDNRVWLYRITTEEGMEE